MTYLNLAEIAAAALAGRCRAVGVTYKGGAWTVARWVALK